MSGELFSIRQAKDGDLELINFYAYAEGMDALKDARSIKVAVNDEDRPVAFINILEDGDVSYVYPIVVYGPWRGYGVGRALIEDAAKSAKELRLVSRGSSTGFYLALGFKACDWSLIKEGMGEDCAHCAHIEECDPLPMRMVC